MKYNPIDKSLFVKNRLKFKQQMVSKSIAVFNSNDIFTTGSDSSLPFHQHRNIFYLSITFLCLIYVNSGSTSELKQLINIFSSSTLISLAFFCVYSFPVSSTDIKLLPIKRKIKLPFYVSVDLFYKYSLSLFLLLTIVFLCYNTYISYTQARFDSQTTIFYAKQLC